MELELMSAVTSGRLTTPDSFKAHASDTNRAPPVTITHASGHAQVVNVAGHVINGDYIERRQEIDEDKRTRPVHNIFVQQLIMLELKSANGWLPRVRQRTIMRLVRYVVDIKALGLLVDQHSWIGKRQQRDLSGSLDRIYQISSSAIEDVMMHCKNKPSSACAYFFFDGRSAESELSSHEKLIRSLIQQLWDELGRIPAALLNAYGNRPSHPQPSINDLEGILHATIEEFREVYLIVDALDECDDREDLLTWISKLSNIQGLELHILFSSRPEHKIEGSIVLLDHLHRIDFAGGSENPDLLKYIDDTLSCKVKWAAKTRDRVRVILLQGADGSFRWVALQLQELGRCLNLRDLNKQLKTLPSGLEESYKRLLCKSENAYDLKRFLEFVAFSARPIKLEELVDIVAIDLQSENGPRYDTDTCYMDHGDVLSVCSGFVTIFEGTIKLAHVTVKDFLLSENISTSPARYFSINVALAHSSISQTCLAYLVQVGTLDSLCDKTIKDFPLARYAAEYWPFHLRECKDMVPSFQALLSQVFLPTSNTYINWMWLIHTLPRWNWLMPASRVWQRAEVQRLSDKMSSPLFVAALLDQQAIVEDLLVCATSMARNRRWYHEALQWAAYAEYWDVVKLLLYHAGRLGVPVEGYGSSVLVLAASRGHVSTVNDLLDSGLDPNTPSWMSSESMTLRRGQEPTLKIVLRGLVNHPTPSERHKIALHAASSAGHFDIVQSLITHNADASVCDDENNETALHHASRDGNEPAVKLLLQHNANVDALGGKWVTSLYSASAKGQSDEVLTLLEDDSGPLSITPLQHALTNGHQNIVQLLREHGASTHTCYDRVLTAALAHATRASKEAVMRLLFEKGATLCDSEKIFAVVFHQASSQGQTTLSDLLLAHGLQVNVAGDGGETALHAASEAGQMGMLQLLFVNGADVEARTTDGRTPLHVAALAGQDDSMQLLLNNGANIEARTADGQTALHAAAVAGQDSSMLLLLKKGVDVESRANDDQTPLHAAAFAGQDNSILLLLNNSANVGAQTRDGLTALHAAALAGHDKIILLLLKKGADIEAQTTDGQTPLHVATLAGQDRSMLLLLNKGANIEARTIYDRTPLHVASLTSNEGNILLLLREGANVEARTIDGHTPLHAAASEGKERSMLLLLNGGADPEARTTHGATALHLALRAMQMIILDAEARRVDGYAMLNQEDVVKFLLARHVKINVQDTGGNTPLHVALMAKCEYLVDELLHCGAQPGLSRRDGATPLHIASMHGSERNMKSLLSRGVNIDARKVNGDTALHLATKSERLNAVRFLLTEGADPNLPGEDGRTALQWAQRSGSREIELLLLEKGASSIDAGNKSQRAIGKIRRALKVLIHSRASEGQI
ncbi:hypothetical protein HWV62_6755 [Athelia sp. TMB]|nr:hypothetical protein HWV62_6755 [Athelia sp. TMB]